MVDDLPSRSGDEVPARVHTRAIVWVAVIATVVLGSSAIALADQAPSNSARTIAETFLPPDGSAATLEYNDGTSWIVESAYTTGVRFLLQQPSLAGEHQLNRFTALGQDPSQARFFRETWADVGGERSQVTALYQLDNDGIRLLTISGGPNGFSFDPGVLVLPADVAPGSSWSGSGAALPQGIVSYESKGSAEAGNDGCIVVDLAIDYRDPADNSVLLSSTQASTWCPGEGVTGERFANNGEPGSSRSTPVDQRDLGVTSTIFTPDFSGYSSWEAASLPLVQRDPLFGESTLPGTTDAAAAVLASGVAAFNTGSDVVAYRPGDGEAERAWIARPGGDIVRIAAVGDVLLVATTERKVRAYDALGRRGWTATFSDVLAGVPVSDGDDGAIMLAIDGELRRVNVDDGELLWSTTLGADAELSPAVGGDAVFAVDRSGALHALALDDGAALWTAPIEKAAAIAATTDSVFVITQDGGLYSWDSETGAERWWDGLSGVPERVIARDGLVLVQTTEGTAAYDDSGYRLWSSPLSEALLTDGERFLALGASVAVLLDADGSELSSWPVQPEDLSYTRYLVAVPGGFWLVNTNFEVLAVTEQ